MPEPPYDPRAIANLLLDVADDLGIEITNLALQKLLYFAHAHFLIGTGQPLVRGAFEAWTYGPVHVGVYKAFKSAGAIPIAVRAMKIDITTGDESEIQKVQDLRAKRCVVGVVHAYGSLSPGRLVEISHAPNSPWAKVVENARTSIALGMRISDALTLELFKHQKVSIKLESRVGEPDEDTPIAGYGSS